MHETPHAFFHLDHPVEGSHPPAGPVTLRGWAAGKNGRPLADLRVRVAGTAHPVIYGFPRTDLAVFFGLRDPFLPGGFETTVPLPVGGQELVFEALDISGQWHRCGMVRLTGDPASPATPPAPAAPATILPHEFARALQCALRADSTVPLNVVAGDLVAALPRPAVLRYPHVPFHGHLHQPTLLERVLFGRLRIEGWLFHESAAIRRVVATVDLQAWHELEQAGSKPYVEAMFPQFPQAKHCRIDGLIDVPAQLPNPLCVRIYAELADGTWHLCHVQRTHAWDQEQEKVPFAPFSRVAFGRACLALDRACRERGFAVPRTRQLWTGIRGVYQESKTRTRQPRPEPALADEPAGAAAPLRQATFITHNLSHEGAPLFLFEFARHLAAGGTSLQVISAADGPLAADYARLGARVQVVDTGALHTAKSSRELAEAITRLGEGINLADSELVVANTLSAYWGVHLARRAGRPALFYIHESTTPATFYLGHMAPATLPLIEETFRLATHVSFLTETTRIYYRPWLAADNHSINPGWIDLPAIDRYLAANPRAALRRQLDLDQSTRLVINVGSVCDRKGQHIFARGVDLLWRQAPDLAKSCQFLMVGGRDTLFDRDLQRLLGHLDRPNLRIIPATSTPLAYYGAADLFVCSSYEESFPRVIMEAMACRVPILSTAVHGIRDLLTSGTDGWLMPPGHSQAISEGLQHLLANPGLTGEMATRARARVEAGYSTATLLPRHAALATRAARRKV